VHERQSLCIWFNKILITCISQPLYYVMPYMPNVTKCICQKKLTSLIRLCPK
jgi:hypothetical protein